MPMVEARNYLLGFSGIGPKTANCILLFSKLHAVFPVDTHIHRIAIRLGWLPPRTSADQAHDLLEPAIAPADRYEMHVLLVTHARQSCKAQPAVRSLPTPAALPHGPASEQHQEHLSPVYAAFP
jgi:endonuclease-3